MYIFIWSPFHNCYYLINKDISGQSFAWASAKVKVELLYKYRGSTFQKRWNNYIKIEGVHSKKGE